MDVTISDTCSLVLGDCREVLAGLEPGSVDLVFADPPYRLSGGGISCQGGQQVSVDKGDWDRPTTPEEGLAFDLSWLRECRRVLRPTGSLWACGTFHNIFSVGYALVINLVTWRKPNPPPNLGCRAFTHSAEALVWATPGGEGHTYHYDLMRLENGGTQMTDVWTISAHDRGEARIHPTQKPIALLDRIIRCSSNPGNLVVDPFSGSGTTGVAALNGDRRFLGIERDPAHYERSVQRLRGVLSWREDLAPFLETQ